MSQKRFDRWCQIPVRAAVHHIILKTRMPTVSRTVVATTHFRITGRTGIQAAIDHWESEAKAGVE